MKTNVILVIALILVLAVIIFGVFQFTQNKNQLKEILAKGGFAEINPPHNLIPPGTIAFVDDTDGRSILKVVCTCENAFGPDVQKHLVQSPSASMDIARDMEQTFELGVDGIKRLTSFSRLNIIKKVKLHLSHVQILEIPDDAVAKLKTQRTTYCQQAINARLGRGHQVTVIKRVVRADAEYIVEFENEAGSNVKMEALKDMSTNLSASVSSKDANTLIGSQLFWGVDDDLELLALDPTISPVKIDPGESKLIAGKTYEVYPDTENKDPNTWFNAYYALIQKELDSAKSELVVARALGKPWDSLYKAKAGLPEDLVSEFYSRAGLETETLQSDLSNLDELLAKKGPMWITSNPNSGLPGTLLLETKKYAGGTAYVTINPVTKEQSTLTLSAIQKAIKGEQLEFKWTIGPTFKDNGVEAVYLKSEIPRE